MPLYPPDISAPGGIPSGTTAERPSAVDGSLYYNTTLNLYEVVIDSVWYAVQTVNPSSIASTTYLFDDMITGDSSATDAATIHGSQANWQTAMAGTGTQITFDTTGITAADKCLGVVSIQTGTVATNRCGMTLGESSILFGSASLSSEWRLRMGTLSTAAQEYNVYVGFIDNMGAVAEPVDGVYFKYDRNTSVNWIITTSNNSTRTNTTTGVAVSATTFQKLKAVVNDTGTSVEFFIDGVSVGTHTTNIPTGAGRWTGFGTKIEKTAGTTNVSMYVDYATLQYTYATPR